MMDLLNQGKLLLLLETLQQQHDCTFHRCPSYKCNEMNESWLAFLELSKVYEMGH